MPPDRTRRLIDGMLSAGVLDVEDIGGLKADELTELASEAVRPALRGFDAETVAAALKPQPIAASPGGAPSALANTPA